MSFRTRLFVLQAAALAITVASAVVAIAALEVTTRSADRVTAQLVRDLALADQLRLDGERLVATSRGYLLSGDESYRTRSHGLEAQIDATLDRIGLLARNDDVSPIGNALRFVPPGGRVKVTVVADDKEVQFEVVDTGSGIPAHQLPHVFDRYYRSEGPHDGVGLGLHICRRLVEAHHGRIGVESIVDVGTTFWFTLPVGPAYLT